MKLKNTIALLALAGLPTAAMAQLSFGPAASTPIAQQPSGVATGLFNADAFVDMAVVADTQDRIQIFLGDGAGGFTMGQTILLGANAGGGHLIAGNFHGGPETDLAVSLQNQNAVRTFVNTGGTFTQASNNAVGANPRGLASGDHNSDGLLDIAVANRDSNSASILTNNGAGFSVVTVAAGLEPRDVAFVGTDLAVSNNDDRTVTLHANSGGAFPLTQTLPVNAALRPEGIVSGDFNGDGIPDIAAATETFVTVWLNAGGFGARAEYALTGDSGDIIAGDFDCDGTMDLATANQDSNNATVIANLGAGTFGGAITIATGLAPSNLAAGDFDGDGGADLAITNRDSNSVSVALNTGCSGVGPNICVADINNDGTVDVNDLNILLSEWGSTCQ